MYYLIAIVLFIFIFILFLIPKKSPVGWDHNEYPAYFEKFEDKKSPIFEYPPNTPSPADIYNNQPYHLLNDEFQSPRDKESLSCVNSRSCYATDFEKVISKTGNFRQFTNNYKRGYPDSCSAPYQELVLNFYKADPM